MKKLLMEGPVGHMWHPFDLDQVKSGKDLLSIFENEVVEYINKFSPSIKIDGINGPIRLVANKDGEKEFAIDRLSTAPIDREGVTADRLRERFEKAILILIETGDEIKLPLHKLAAFVDLDTIEIGKNINIIHRKKKYTARIKEITSGHGFVNDGSIALKVLNNAYNDRQGEMEAILDRLGMLDNPNICLNNDIVHESSKKSGMVNAVSYEEDFIAFHGLNKIFVPEGKKARKTKEIRMTSDQKRALQDLVNICNETNTVEGFRVLSPFDTVSLKGEMDIDYSEALGTPIALHMDEEHAVSKSLGEWLLDSKIFKPAYDEKFLFADGRSRAYFSKDVYVHLIPDEGEQVHSVAQILDPSVELTEDDFYKFASGAIFYHATRLLGRAVLRTLVNKSKVGSEDLTRHEGVVMRSQKIFGVDKPVKITGDFIRTGMVGSISKVIKEEMHDIVGMSQIKDDFPPEIGDEKEEMGMGGGLKLAIVPGSFKPPHMGHRKMVEALAEMADEVLIFVSAPGKASKRLLPFSNVDITYEKAFDLWNFLLQGAPTNVKLVESKTPHASPIQALEQIMLPVEERNSYTDVDINPEKYSKFLLGMSEKERDDPASMARFEQYKDNPRVEIVLVPIYSHPPEYGEEVKRIIASYPDIVGAIDADRDTKAAEIADSLVSSRARKKLPANPAFEDFMTLLSKANKEKVKKFLKVSPKELDKEGYSATDLRTLLDLKKVYNLPVDELLKDFVGDNVEEYMKIIYGEGQVTNESMNAIEALIKGILDEMSTMGGGAVEGGNMPGDKKKEKNQDTLIREEGDEHMFPYSELPIQQKSMRRIAVSIIGSSKHRPTGVGSDAGYKKAVSNKFKFDIGKSNMERNPYFSPGDTIEDLVEMLYESLTS